MKLIRKITKQYMLLKCLVLTSVLGIVFAACNDDETVKQLFEKSATERTQATVSELRTILTDTIGFGWNLTYRPAEETGYFRFLFKFNKDSTVQTWSNIDDLTFGDDAGNSISEFDIVQGTTTKLSFITQGSIHRLSDSGLSPIPGAGGSGLRGEFEFLYYGSSANGDTLTFRINRTPPGSEPSNRIQPTVKFVRAESDSRSALTTESVLENLVSESVYNELVYDPGNGLPLGFANIDFNRTRTLTLRWFIDKKEAGNDTSYLDISEYTAAMDFLSGNRVRLDFLSPLRFPRSIEDNDELISNVILRYESATNSLNSVEINGKSSDEGFSRFSIRTRREPFVTSIAHEVIIDTIKTSHLIYINEDFSVTEGLNSPEFKKIYDKYAAESFFLQTIIEVDFNTTKEFLYVDQGAEGMLNFFNKLEYVISPDGRRLIFLDRGVFDDETLRNGAPQNPNAPAIDPSGQEFFDLITDSEGFFVEDTEIPFRINSVLHTVYTLTSASNPAVRMALFHSPDFFP